MFKRILLRTRFALYREWSSFVIILIAVTAALVWVAVSTAAAPVPAPAHQIAPAPACATTFIASMTGPNAEAAAAAYACAGPVLRERMGSAEQAVALNARFKVLPELEYVGTSGPYSFYTLRNPSGKLMWYVVTVDADTGLVIEVE